MKMGFSQRVLDMSKVTSVLKRGFTYNLCMHVGHEETYTCATKYMTKWVSDLSVVWCSRHDIRVYEASYLMYDTNDW